MDLTRPRVDLNGAAILAHVICLIMFRSVRRFAVDMVGIMCNVAFMYCLLGINDCLQLFSFVC